MPQIFSARTDRRLRRLLLAAAVVVAAAAGLLFYHVRSASYWGVGGQAEMRDGRYHEAVASLERAVAVDPGFTHARLRLAIAAQVVPAPGGIEDGQRLERVVGPLLALEVDRGIARIFWRRRGLPVLALKAFQAGPGFYQRAVHREVLIGQELAVSRLAHHRIEEPTRQIGPWTARPVASYQTGDMSQFDAVVYIDVEDDAIVRRMTGRRTDPALASSNKRGLLAYAHLQPNRKKALFEAQKKMSQSL